MKKAVSLVLVLMVLFSFLNAASAESGEPFSWRVLEDGSALITGYSGHREEFYDTPKPDGGRDSGQHGNDRHQFVCVLQKARGDYDSRRRNENRRQFCRLREGTGDPGRERKLCGAVLYGERAEL